MKAKSPNSIDVYVGNRVRVRRKTLGMTQNGLAELLGITFQQIQKYEKGTNRIGASRLQRISEILRVPIGFFFENGGAGPIDGATNELNSFLSSKEGLALNKAFIAIEDPNIRQKLVALAKSLAVTGLSDSDNELQDSVVNS
ncbi:MULTISPECIES: helix-turn-helix domain-containing protein [Rhizobium]|jgi:transcriptional regulator with XRE-family HTH domain|uniref:Transcriptional regulator, XRE family n=1 Tax=Rhizobium leguminosarum bv. trifolii (strain WSM1325) TaxID=395491 RepID=C6ATW5_RHILS|nr:helix-turn-helix transcriptional regulator [Rhizobium leguminosarum]ACS57457.1 transcriptional regulator, XRE family [Rhizobium leguminosarum bv. trifolii WSM1325]MBY2905782.1 helix-turn-helix transcriptional regulator [Rhizobium leguminosarum]MBY2912802.1 helix-turn-helix transcriptional regulator [Rhizobium leguminosarum]MBY2921358.1 helix-turn-helix transcriptional regulator [Rhizobium leguminosarum]MBY2941717.1 helix-turn-helix transcriptional regulator [Rhizobium leguminosarum]